MKPQSPSENSRRSGAEPASKHKASSRDQSYTLLLDPVEKGWAIADEQSRVSFATEGFCTALGYDPDDIVGRSAQELLGQRTSGQKNGGTRKGKACKAFSIGSILERVLRESAGTKAKRVLPPGERARTKYAQNLLRIFDSDPDSIIITQPDGTIDYVNKAFEKVTGYSSSEIVGKDPSVLASGLHDPRRYELLWSTILKGETYNGAFINCRKDGGLFFQNVVIVPIRETSERISAFVAIGQDHTQPIYPGLSRDSATDIDWAPLNTLPGLFYILQPGKPIDVRCTEDSFQRMTGFSLLELSERGNFPLNCLITGSDIKRRDRCIRKALKGDGELFVLGYWIKHKSGSERALLEVGRLLSSPLSTKQRVGGVVLDVSDADDFSNLVKEMEEHRQSVSKEFIRLQEAERKRVAHELHDSIGQGLTSIKMRVENALAFLSDKRVEEGEQILRETVKLSRETMDEIRRISANLRPSILDDLGLVSTIRWFCREYGATYRNINVDLELGVDEEEVPDNQKIVIYRILQEAMHNVAKHSDAKVVHIELRRTDEEITLVVQDNGRGGVFAKTKPGTLSGSSFGLFSMEERVNAAGGKLSIRSEIDIGTSVCAILPSK